MHVCMHALEYKAYHEQLKHCVHACIKMFSRLSCKPLHYADDPNERALKERIMKYMKPDLIDFPKLIPLLNKYHLLDQTDVYELKNPLLSPSKKADALVYKILPSRGPGAFTLFFKCLQEEKHHMGHHTLAGLFTFPIQCEELEDIGHQNMNVPVQCVDKEQIDHQQLVGIPDYTVSLSHRKLIAFSTRCKLFDMYMHACI